MYELDYSIDKSVFPLRDKVCGLFKIYLIEEGIVKSITETRKEICDITVGVFINNCIRSAKGKMMVPLNKNVYSRGAIRNGCKLKTKPSYTYTKHLIQFLTSNHWGSFTVGGKEFDKGFKVGGKRQYSESTSECSYFTLSYEFREMINEYIRLNKPSQIKNVYVIKDKDKVSTTYKMTSTIKSNITSLHGYNYVGVNSKVQLTDGIDTYIYDPQLRRICNMDSKTNARHYNVDIQTLSKRQRKLLTIDGNDTCAFDFRAFEPSIAYSLNQEIMEGDPYQVYIKDYDSKLLRSIGKLCMLRLLYAANRKEAVYSVGNEIYKEYNLSELKEKGKIPDNVLPVNEIMDLLESKHRKISNYFYGNGEQSLPYVGSNIIDYIINYFVQNKGVIVIPVFDEVIASVEHRGLLREVMEKGYNKVLGFTDNCVITEEY